MRTVLTVDRETRTIRPAKKQAAERLGLEVISEHEANKLTRDIWSPMYRYTKQYTTIK